MTRTVTIDPETGHGSNWRRWAQMTKEEIERLVRAENWPPGIAPWVPFALRREVAERRQLLWDAEARLFDAEIESGRQRTLAWIGWHTEHGWPDDADYRRRLTGKVGP